MSEATQRIRGTSQRAQGSRKTWSRTLRVTRAMEAGIAGHIWSIEEIVNLLEVSEVRDAA
jgi:hypothetical protein